MYYKKRVTALALAGLIGMMTLTPVAETHAASAWSKVDGTYQMIDGSSINGVVARGIDVSHWKQSIDWNAVAADDVEFVMLGTRYNGEVDPYFRINADGAHKAGIKLGAYIYSYATTPEMAIQEADFILDLMKDYPISYPVAFDVEASVMETLTPAQISELINVFCQRIEAAGYYPMLYANDYWLANKIDMSQVKYDVWVARYEKKHNFSNPAMWQATSTGRVSGVQGNVDINFQYKDYSGIIPANRWRTIGTNTYYYQNYLMQKSSWINDGLGWFYMNESGNPAKGWLQASNGNFHLDDVTGMMSTGWKQLDSKWYYFAGDGAMNTGWLDQDSKKYYLNDNGSMATGWMQLDAKSYYFAEDGSMNTGWSLLDGSHYYFNNSGDMARGWANPDGSWYYLANDGKMAMGWYTDQTGSYYMSTSSGKMTTGWRQIDGSWYHFNGSGQMQTGFVSVDNNTYYMNPSDGKMIANSTFTIDGINYQADTNGICQQLTTSPEGGSNTGDTAPGTPETTAPAQSEPKQIGPGM